MRNRLRRGSYVFFSRSVLLDVFCVLILSFLFAMGRSWSGEVRTWTSADGTSARAELLSFDGEMVRVRSSETERVYTMSLDKFCEEDQAYLLRKIGRGERRPEGAREEVEHGGQVLPKQDERRPEGAREEVEHGGQVLSQRDEYYLEDASGGMLGEDASGGMLGLFFFTFSTVLPLAVCLLMLLSVWRIFVKAGRPGWAVLIPIYNLYVMHKIAGKPGWWLLLYFIPVVGVIIGILELIGLAESFGKGWVYALGLLILPFVYYPMLAFGDAEYGAAACAWS